VAGLAPLLALPPVALAARPFVLHILRGIRTSGPPARSRVVVIHAPRTRDPLNGRRAVAPIAAADRGKTMDTWILGTVRARCVRRIAAWAVVLATVALVGLGQLRYIRNFLLGPYVLGAAELDAIGNVSEAPRYFVRVTGARARPTGLQQITVRRRGGVETSRKVSAAYYALAVGDKFLICRSASGVRTTYEGELVPLPADLAGRLFDTPDAMAMRDRFFPFYVNSASFRLPGYLAMAGFLVLALLFVWQALPAWKHFRDPASHPLIKRVLTWGDPVGLAGAAQQEAGSPRYKGGSGWAVTDQYLIRSTFFTFDLLRLSDLLWAYKVVTKHSYNLIPTGKTYDAVLFCYGGVAMIESKEATTDAILGFAAQRAPWAIYGFSKDLQDYFNKDRRAFCEAVEQRRQEWTQRG